MVVSVAHLLCSVLRIPTFQKRRQRCHHNERTIMTMRIIVGKIHLQFLLLLIVTAIYCESGQAILYGPSDDASWAIQSARPSTLLTNDKGELYERYIRQCDLAAQEEQRRDGLPNDPHFCTSNDEFRIRMNREQPASVYNYTKLGYQKIRAPPHLFELIHNFYEANKHRAAIEWSNVNTYQNMWEYPSTMVRIEDASLAGGGHRLHDQVTKAVQKVLEEWTGQKLKQVSLYGVREYHRGSLLAPHVDRMPLITSAIINIDQIGVEEPWVLEVYGHDGKAANVTMEVGDMVLYESHSVIHGRPFPLKGELFANVFVHFEPTDTSSYNPRVGLPPYIIPGSIWEKTWRQDYPNGWLGDQSSGDENDSGDEEEDEDEEEIDGIEDELIAINAVFQGDVELLREIGKENPEALHEPDENGWHALHEAVRIGNLEMVQVLLDNGADVNQETDHEQTPLSLALRYLGEDHPMISFLLDQGAEDFSADL